MYIKVGNKNIIFCFWFIYIRKSRGFKLFNVIDVVFREFFILIIFYKEDWFDF